MALLIGGSFVAPWLESTGNDELADRLYGLYRYLCHQLPYRSSFVFGHKVCLCDRCVALYAGMLLGGLLYTGIRGRIRSASFTVFALFCIPIAVDGFTQLFGWRESDFTLRVSTGLIFGLGSAWLAYPMLDAVWRGTSVQLARPALAAPPSAEAD